MGRLASFIAKEFLLLRRDMHGLALLFIMPIVFIVIMSLALQNQFSRDSDVRIDYFLAAQGNDEVTEEFLRRLVAIKNFHRLPSSAGIKELEEQVSRDQASFLVVMAPDFGERLAEGLPVIDLYASPGADPTLLLMFESRLRDLLGRLYLMIAQAMLEAEAGGHRLMDDQAMDGLLQFYSLYRGENEQRIPSAVQQNVPAWLLFAMFFIATPISTAIIQERSQRTLDRLVTMDFPPWLMLVGKLVPYTAINLFQVVLMLLVGVYLMPLLGAERLSLGHSPGGLAIIALSASLAAVCYGLLVAQLANTTEQATIFTGVCNIIMAALGGVMVPAFIMPPVMQQLTQLSPMAWGLDGFLEVMLRNGRAVDVLPQALALLLLAVVLLVLSVLLGRRRSGG